MNVPPLKYNELKKYYHKLGFDERAEFISSLKPETYNWLRYSTDFMLRPEQVVPEDFLGRYYVALTGRGWGKSYAGAFFIADKMKKGKRGLALVAPTYKDLLDTMIPAIMDHFPPNDRPTFVDGNKKWINYKDVRVQCFTSETPIRGGNFSYVWADELPRWNDGQADKIEKSFNVLDYACRKGRSLFFVTTTPIPIPLIVRWDKMDQDKDPLIKIVRGTIDDNNALSPQAVDALVLQYGKTRLGRQELYGDLLTDTPGALWNAQLIEKQRITIRDYKVKAVNGQLELIRIVIGVDPSVASGTGTDECGIIVVGLGDDGNVYILDDYSGQMSPDEWGKKALKAYDDYGADKIIAESNNGGDLVKINIKRLNRYANVELIHAAKSKIARAEPVAGLFEDGQCFLVGDYPELEDQLTKFTGAPRQKSPDRLDAMVWAVHELVFSQHGPPPDLSGMGSF